MKIDRQLNVVIPITRDDESTIYAHVTPVSREVFDANFIVMSKAFAAIYAEGLNHIAGPMVAMRVIKHVAKDLKMEQEVATGLLAEIRRLTNILAPPAFAPIPLDVALQQEIISLEDADEVENAAAFFTLSSAMHRRQDRKSFMERAASLWGAQVTSSTIMESSASWLKSTQDAATKAKPASTQS